MTNQPTEPVELEQPEVGAAPIGPTEPGGGNREAAKYRTRLREAEAERDGLQAQVTTLRRGIVEQQSGLRQPGALWVAGTDLDALFTAEGQPDPERIAEAVEAAVQTLGLVIDAGQMTPDRSQGAGSVTPQPDSFAKAFGPRR